ncbi:STAS domain-containing protein [Chloroflexales bacterium ZM16-3]|nr:STAS domain-containing protein [Chloroflexales bacterium ZM16-3]
MPTSEALPPIMIALISLLFLATLMLWLAPVIALVLLRRGRFAAAVAMAVWGLLFGHTIATYALGVTDPSVYVVYQIPITLAGLLGGRRMLLAVSGYGIGFVLLVGFLQSMSPPQAGFFSAAAMAAAMGGTATTPDLGQPLVFFVAVTLLISLMLDRFGAALRGALSQALEREAELEGIRGSLEVMVGERTAALETALHDIRRQADEQNLLLTENAQQRDFIREMSVPVLPISNDTLVMPLVGALDSARLAHIQEQALGRLESTRARHLLLDITGVPVVDTQVAQGLIRVVQAARLLGALVTLVGIRPEVAQSIVGLGIDLRDIRTHSTLQSALGHAV